MKALVISGGGSKGAFAGGVAEFLMKECGERYDLLMGTSTGSLMIPMIALGEIDRLKEVYTSVTEKDIFNVCPFTFTRHKGIVKTGLNHSGILWQFLKGEKTFGSSKPLRELIVQTYTPDDFEKIKKLNIDLIVTVTNITLKTVEYKNLKECNYEDFCDWIWISANMIPFMSLVSKNGYEYADGGISNIVPIREAIKRGAEKVDVIVLKPHLQTSQSPLTKNVFSLTMTMFEIMVNQISITDVAIGVLEQNLNHDVDIHFYHTPNVLTDNPLNFEPKKMALWWKQGYNYAKENDPQFCRLKKLE